MPSISRIVGATSASTPPSGSQLRTLDGDDHGHRVQRVRGVGRAVVLEHLVGVAVVGGDEQRAAGVLDDPTTLAEARVDGLDRGDRGRDDAGVADHVGVGEVDDPEAEVAVAPGVDERVARLPRAHLGLAGRRSARRAAMARARAPRPAPGCSSPPPKKYVTCGYFSVSATCSCRPPVAAITFGQRDLRARRRERHRVGPARLVLGERHVALDRLGAAAVDVVERRIGERQRDLAHPVGAEVERDDRVARAGSAPRRRRSSR